MVQFLEVIFLPYFAPTGHLLEAQEPKMTGMMRALVRQGSLVWSLSVDPSTKKSLFQLLYQTAYLLLVRKELRDLEFIGLEIPFKCGIFMNIYSLCTEL